ncbi:MAG: TonB-dependent receptor, partial [Desulfobacterales bacterium]|nr:TonB-dependent receptor [Desulfobacterales bacterium]
IVTVGIAYLTTLDSPKVIIGIVGSLVVSMSFLQIVVNHYLIGYKKKTVEAIPGEFLTIELELEPFAAHEVIVSADSVVSDSRVKNTVALDKMEVYTLPGTAADPIIASQILPGVNSLPDSSTLLIRGGAPEEVAFYFDGVEVEHPFLSESLHESYFSIFDNQIIDGFSVSSGGFHTKFGDALSGVMDISAKDSIFQREGGVGLSIMGLNSYIGMPIKKVGSFVGSYNNGYSYLMTKINNRDDSEFKTQNGFGKLIFNLNPSLTVRALGLLNTYDFSHVDGFNLNSKNQILGFSLTSSFLKNLVSRLVISHVKHRTDFEVLDVFKKDLEDTLFQARLDTTLDLEKHYLEFGGDIQGRRIEVSYVDQDVSSDRFEAKGTRLGMYFNDRFRFSDKLYIDLGARLLGLRIQKFKYRFEPRASLAYFLSRNDILRLSVGRYNQFGDYFTLTKYDTLEPKNSTHMALSYDRITEAMDFRITAYNKEYRKLFLNTEEDMVVNLGHGYARGAEIFLKYTHKYFDTLFVYNFLNSKRKENEVLELLRSPYEIDHSLTGIFTMKFKNASLGIRYSFARGLPFTPLLGREWDEENLLYLPHWGTPYSQHQRSYQRMDLNGSKNIKIKNNIVVLYFGITNLLNNKNVLRHMYSEDYSVRNNQYSIFGRSFFVGIYIPIF